MTLNHWIATATLALFMAGPALGLVVVEEDFEDDVVDESTFFNWELDENGEKVPDPHFDGTYPERGLGFLQRQTGHINNSAPTNVGRPGRWIPNQYKVGSPDEDGQGYQGGKWFDPLEQDPDTDWQMAVVTDFRMMSINTDGPPRDGNEGFIINHHQGDCTADTCDGGATFRTHKMAREGFIKFTDAAGNDVATQAGDVLRGKIMIAPTEGVPVLGFSSDIQAMADATGKMGEDINGDGKADHLPLSKWSVGFGQAFNPIDGGITGWQASAIQPNVVSQFGFSIGFNMTYTMTWTPVPDEELADCIVCSNQVHLTPDTDVCGGTQLADGACDVAGIDDLMTSPFVRPTNNEPLFRYQLLEFEYAVGSDYYDLLQLDGDDVMACDTANAGKDCDDADTPGAPEAGNVPITRPNDVIDGFFVGQSYTKNGNSFFFDDICITINESLDSCNLTGGGPGTGGGGDPEPTVLLGDANNDDQVTGSDLIAVQQNFGTVYQSDSACDGLGLGDANDDCQVTGSDLIAVQQNFGTVATAAPVPEPATAALVGLGLLAAIGRRRRA